VLVDSRATKDKWEKINPLLLAEIKQLDLPMKALAIGDNPSPLVEALASNPPLLVLGSYRAYTESELVALDYYLWGGGKVFVAASATLYFQSRLANVNTFLGPRGMVVTLRRPRGQVQLTAELGEPRAGPTAPFGLLVRGDTLKLATVGDRVIAGGLDYGRGAVVAMDIGPLWQVADYRGVVGEVLRWLMKRKPPEDQPGQGPAPGA